MRQFIIRSFETLIWIFGGFVALAGVIGGIALLAQGQAQGLLFIIGGPLYAILIMGFVFIALAISENTRRTAEAVEKLASRGP